MQEKPSFTYRKSGFTNAVKGDYAKRLRMEEDVNLIEINGNWNHNAIYCVLPNIYESTHPKWYDYETKDYFIDLDCKYPAILNSDEPIIVYIQDEGLPEINTDLNLDKSIIKSFHDRYYELLIFLEIIDTITNSIDNQELNKRLGRLFRLCSCIGTKEDSDGNIFLSHRRLSHICQTQVPKQVQAYHMPLP